MGFGRGHRDGIPEQALPEPPPPAPTTEELLLEGDFGGPPGAGGTLRFHLRLTRTELRIQAGGCGGGGGGVPGGVGVPVGGVLRLCDVVGSHTLRAPALPRAAFFAVYAYPARSDRSGGVTARGRGGRRRRRRAPTFRVDASPHYEGNRATAERWAGVIRCLVRGLPLPPENGIPPEPPRRRLLLLLNPCGGRGQALSWCQSHILPMISEAGIGYNLVQTERANHARELVAGLSLEEWDGIVTVSGDGLLYEVVNGLMDRPDWAAALSTPLGILPCGSGNALAAAINCQAGLSPALGLPLLLNCALLLCRGSPSPLDLVSVTTASGLRVFSFLSVAWGLLADVDIESERLRRLGPARFALGAAARLLALQTYRGRLSYLPALPRSATHTEGTAGGTAGTGTLPRAISDPLGLCTGTASGAATPEGDGGDWGEEEEAEGGAGGTEGLEGTEEGIEGARGLGGSEGQRETSELGGAKGIGGTEGPRETSEPVGTEEGLGGTPSREGAAAAAVPGQGSSSLCPVGTAGRGQVPAGTPSPGGATSGGASRQTLEAGGSSGVGTSGRDEGGPKGGTEGASGQGGDEDAPKGGTEGASGQGGDEDPPKGGTEGASGQGGDEDPPKGGTEGAPGPAAPLPTSSSPPAATGPVDDLLVPLGQPLPPGWVTLEGDFVLVLAIYQSHLGAELVAAPRARPDDGIIHLCYVRAGVSRGALLRALLAMARAGAGTGGGGSAAEEATPGPPLARVPARAFRLEPLTRRGVLTVDGERVEYGPVQGQIHRGLARLLTPPAP